MGVYCLLKGNQSQSEKVFWAPCLCDGRHLKSNLLGTIHLPLCSPMSGMLHSCNLAFPSLLGQETRLLGRETRAGPVFLNSWIILLLHFPTWCVRVIQFWWPSDLLVPERDLGLSNILSAKSEVWRSSALLESFPWCLCGWSRCMRRCWGLTGEGNIGLPRLN